MWIVPSGHRKVGRFWHLLHSLSRMSKACDLVIFKAVMFFFLFFVQLFARSRRSSSRARIGCSNMNLLSLLWCVKTSCQLLPVESSSVKFEVLCCVMCWPSYQTSCGGSVESRHDQHQPAGHVAKRAGEFWLTTLCRTIPVKPEKLKGDMMTTHVTK